MAYSDNYPNGYKSGYSSWDDPDRRDYSPYGAERARREAGSGIHDTGESAVDWNRARERRIEEKRVQEEYDREQSEEANERRYEVIQFIAKEKREELSKRSPLAKFVAKIKGEKSNQIWDQTFRQAQSEVGEMSKNEIDDFYRKHIR